MANLELGAQLPAWHWDLDVSELRDWAQGVEAIGYQWLGITDHVLYAYATETRAEAPYAGGTIQHEPLTFLAWVAGFTQRVALTTSVVIMDPVIISRPSWTPPPGGWSVTIFLSRRMMFCWVITACVWTGPSVTRLSSANR